MSVVRDVCKAYSLNPNLYARKIQVGFGIWPTRSSMFNSQDFTGNKFQPGDLRNAVRYAMKHADEYAWIWNERVSFWIKGARGKPVLPLQPYVDSESSDVSRLTDPVTVMNAMRASDTGLPSVYLDAILQGKRDALNH